VPPLEVAVVAAAVVEEGFEEVVVQLLVPEDSLPDSRLPLEVGAVELEVAVRVRRDFRGDHRAVRSVIKCAKGPEALVAAAEAGLQDRIHAGEPLW